MLKWLKLKFMFLIIQDYFFLNLQLEVKQLSIIVNCNHIVFIKRVIISTIYKDKLLFFQEI
jgi:hypothetical protein